jgi:hypothetical protein
MEENGDEMEGTCFFCVETRVNRFPVSYTALDLSAYVMDVQPAECTIEKLRQHTCVYNERRRTIKCQPFWRILLRSVGVVARAWHSSLMRHGCCPQMQGTASYRGDKSCRRQSSDGRGRC